MHFIKAKLKANESLLIIVLKLGLIYFSWKLFYWIVGTQFTPYKDRLWPLLSYSWETLNQWVRMADIRSAIVMLETFDFETVNIQDHYFGIVDKASLRVGNYCLGFQLWYYFAMLTIISPIKVQVKALGAFAGFIIIHLLNILRLFGLALVSVYFPEYLHIGHDYVFNVIVLAFLFWVYVYLNNNYSLTYKDA